MKARAHVGDVIIDTAGGLKGAFDEKILSRAEATEFLVSLGCALVESGDISDPDALEMFEAVRNFQKYMNKR